MTDLQVYRGTHANLDLVITSEIGVPVNLQGARLWFTVKQHYSDVVPLIRKASEDGTITIDNAPAGQAHVVVVPDDTKPLPNYKQVFRYDVLCEAEDLREIVVSGLLTILPIVTNES